MCSIVFVTEMCTCFLNKIKTHNWLNEDSVNLFFNRRLLRLTGDIHVFWPILEGGRELCASALAYV